MRFLVAPCRLIVRRPNLEVATRLLHQQVKNTAVVLVPCRVWKCVPTATSGGMDICEVPGCHLLRQINSQWELQFFFQELVSHELTAYLSVFDLFNPMNYGNIIKRM